jgi:hypothetical protein
MNRVAILFLVALQAFLLYTVRVREQLTCSAVAATPRLTCRRIQTRLLRSRDESFVIPDAASVTFHVSGHTTASHASVNTSSIDAVDSIGRRVVLLSVPGQETADAVGFERQLRELHRATPPTFSVIRDESGTAWLILGIMVVWWLAYFGLSRFQAGRPRPRR